MLNDSKVAGRIVKFRRARGFGFIKPEDGDNEVFFHWKDLVIDGSWPYIEIGTEVEFLLDDKDVKPAAKEITLVGGEKIPILTKPYEDHEVNDEETFTGVIKFFENKKGFGVIKPDEEITWEGSSSGEGLYFSRYAILSRNAGSGMVLRLQRGLRVSYKVYKSKKGLSACEIKNEDETPIEYLPKREGRNKKRKRQYDGNKKSPKKAKTIQELIEEREIDDDENSYTGTVKSYIPEKEYGFITLQEDITFKGVTVKDRIYVMKEDIVCYSEEVGLAAGCEVMFKIYKDSKGVGAYEVMNADGTPIEYSS